MNTAEIVKTITIIYTSGVCLAFILAISITEDFTKTIAISLLWPIEVIRFVILAIAYRVMEWFR